MNATITVAEMLVLPEVMPILGATKEDWVKLELGQTAIIAVLLQMWLRPVKSVSTSVWEEVNFIIGVIKKQPFGDFGKLRMSCRTKNILTCVRESILTLSFTTGKRRVLFSYSTRNALHFSGFL